VIVKCVTWSPSVALCRRPSGTGSELSLSRRTGHARVDEFGHDLSHRPTGRRSGFPLDLQLSFFCKIRVPVAMISDSGGKSYHALVQSHATTLAEYQAEAKYLLNELFAQYGVDTKNKNPSRYSRLPGVPRVIGARALQPGETEARQKILYLNSNPSEGPIL
jgi:hypothetical protein